MLRRNIFTLLPLVGSPRHGHTCCSKPKHLLCFKQWTGERIKDILTSAINLKKNIKDSHCKRLDVLSDCKVTVLLEINEPTLVLAVSKAATLLGAQDNIVVDKLLWDTNYNGKVFSYMSDAIFVCTNTHACLQRFADQSSVPVMCMRSRTHSAIQALSTVMAIQEEYGSIKGLNISYFGAPDPVLNSYLLLSPMLEANFKFKCSCKNAPVSPLLYKASTEMCEKHGTDMKACNSKEEVLKDTKVIISNPLSDEQHKDAFQLNLEEIEKNSKKWIYFHSSPRSEEASQNLILHKNSRTFMAFENMQYIAASLLANCVKNILF